ncbi:MAG TPA: asparagine synthase (glutamine-hydrolyzing), partial [Thermodesulfobacteriota bacterium]|nr:asparagine synthase (glutamine-hydrolyzing) [Thermodesulfobacteriota bacterium]
MCGIIAIAGKNTDSIKDSSVEAMLTCIHKRGPDDKGFERAGDSTSDSTSGSILGMTRLAIVDLSPAGHQPMKDNEGPYTIVFNGEIYGYKDLRAELERKGHVFRSHSDTEVILKSYAEYGASCVDHIDGMFAFALWDDAKKELFIARDRFGKKPFYYAFHDGMFIAGSEIKTIFAAGLFKGIVDPGSIADYLRLGYIPPYKTIYSNVHTLPPAHAGIVKDGSLESRRYWQIEKKKTAASYGEAKAEIKRLFAKAVEKRMVADVEIGSLLSGGVDSTIVTLEAHKHMDRPIKTFSVGYGEAKDELSYAKAASEKIGTDHYTLAAEKPDLEALKEVIGYFDEPHADSSDFPQHLVSKLAASKVKVALT